MKVDAPLRIFAAVAALVFIGLAWLGLPRPHVDDPFFVGAAVWLSETGELFNPWVQEWVGAISGGSFLIHVPVYFYLLAGWFWIFGVGTGSALACFALTGWSGAVGAYVVLRRLGMEPLAAWAHGTGLVGMFVVSGLRPDVPAVALCWMGLAGVTGPGWILRILGTALVALGAACWPPVLPYALSLGFLAVFHQVTRVSAWKREVGMWWGAIAAAAVVTGGMVHWMVAGNWVEWFTAMTTAAALRRPEPGQLLPWFFGLAVSRISWPTLVALVLGSILGALHLWKFRANPTYFRSHLLVIAVAVATLGLIGLYPQSTFLAVTMGVMALAGLAGADGRAGQSPERWLWAILGLLALPGWVGPLWGGSPGRISMDEEVRQAMELRREERVIFDEFAYRDVLDLRPPLAWRPWYYVEAGRMAPPFSSRPPGEIWVVREGVERRAMDFPRHRHYGIRVTGRAE